MNIPFQTDFESYPTYDGNDLGVHLCADGFRAKTWAPTAVQVRINIYNTSHSGLAIERIELNKVEDGCWFIHHRGKYKGLFYTIQVKINRWMNETPGIEVKATGVNGRRGLFYDPADTNPSGWRLDKPIPYTNIVDAILYELHVRDFSVAPNSGMQHKGKYLAFTEKDTKNEDGIATGIEHLKELGITHVHLLPVSDYWTVDELRPKERYNWGYDPLNYNTLEGSYATKQDTNIRIIEFKKLVMALHKAGIGVVLDVVYNHTGLSVRSSFNQTVPKYYYRQLEDGKFSNASGCGNELATERTMVRKYIVDSLKYWAEEFHIDGFRFDLMGIIDIETMKKIRTELDNLRPGILLYGEGWAADYSPLDEHSRAVKKNISQLHNIAGFNDDFRDAIKGDNFNAEAHGFVNGQAFSEENIKFGIAAACFHPQIEYGYVKGLGYPWAEEPYQVVNYVSCHDNYTLYDKLKASRPNENETNIKRMQMLAMAIVLSSQGTAFLHAGVEFCRTKFGDHNSYKSVDYINQIDWSRKTLYRDVFQYIKSLIALRKAIPSFRMRNAHEIRTHLHFNTEYHKQTMSFTINEYPSDLWTQVHVVYNARKQAFKHRLPQNTNWTILAEGERVDINGLSAMNGENIVVPPISMMILVCQ